MAVINLNEICNNAEKIEKLAGAPVIAVVKDDAYGHGAERVAGALFRYVRSFAVASVSEGEALRAAGVEKEILVLSPLINREEALRAAWHDLTVSVSSFESLSLLIDAAKADRLFFKAHLCVNTGMNRYGFAPRDIEEACQEAGERVRVTGVYSHLYRAEDRLTSERQRLLFEKAARTVKGYYPKAVSHLAASGGALLGRDYVFDLVRCGLALYGYLPFESEKLNVKPAMKVYAPVAQNTRRLGEGFGYGVKSGRDQTRTLRYGYGDGFFMKEGLCMDACVEEGGGTFGENVLVMDDAAAYGKRQGVSTYQALVNIGSRAVKVYV